MKTPKNHLDVDFIKSRPLTKAEAEGLSEFIKKLKSKKRKTSAKGPATKQRRETGTRKRSGEVKINHSFTQSPYHSPGFLAPMNASGLVINPSNKAAR